jgi:NADPH2:quinone reductase
MKAVQISRFGGPEVLQTVEVPTPIPAAGQLLVRLRSIGVNLADALTRMDRYAVTPPLPAILGAEAAGIVEAVGENVRGFAAGQRVAVPLFANNSLGAYAEFAVIDAGLAVPLPDAIPLNRPRRS